MGVYFSPCQYTSIPAPHKSECRHYDDVTGQLVSVFAQLRWPNSCQVLTTIYAANTLVKILTTVLAVKLQQPAFFPCVHRSVPCKLRHLLIHSSGGFTLQMHMRYELALLGLHWQLKTEMGFSRVHISF